jgi:hypothetical protein
MGRRNRPGAAGRLISIKVTAEQPTGEARVTIRGLLRAALTVPVMIGGWLLVTAGPAAACSCARISEAEVAARVDAVFVGRLVGSRVDPSALTREYRAREYREYREQVGQAMKLADRRQRASFADQLRGPMRNVDPVVLTFEVTRVYKGVVGKPQEIVFPRPAGGEACGSYVPSGPGPWLVFAQRSVGDVYQLDPGQYASGFSSVCAGGSRALADGGAPALGGLAGESGWPDSLVGVGALAVAVAAGLGLAALRARHRARVN